MTTATTKIETNSIITGDCIQVLKTLPAKSIDLVLTDPPYLASYRSRDGRTVLNDDNPEWLEPAFAEVYRVLRPDSFCITFYGWGAVDRFMAAFRRAGFYPVSHLSFVKRYPSCTGYTRAHHEMAYVLAKGKPARPAAPISDVLGWTYTGNKLHPTQKPVGSLTPIVKAFSEPGALILDPFCGSGSTLVAAKNSGRRYLGIELDPHHAGLARRRLDQGEELAA